MPITIVLFLATDRPDFSGYLTVRRRDDEG
jgi:hypothetical protein